MNKPVDFARFAWVALIVAGGCKPDLAALKEGRTNQAGGMAGDTGTGGSGVSGPGGSGGGPVSTSCGGSCSVASAGLVNSAGTGAVSTTVSPGGNSATWIAGAGGALAAGTGGALAAGSGGTGTAGAGSGKFGGSAGVGGDSTRCEIPTVVPGNPPVLRYDFDTGSGDVAVDGSGNSRDGTILGAAPWSSTGRLGGAITLNAANQYVQLPQDIVTNLSAITVAAWIKLSANPALSALFDFGSNATNHFYLRTNGGTSSATGITFGAQVNGGPAQEIATSYALPTGVWKHVALVLGEGTASLYIDGLGVVSRAMTFAPSALGSTAGNWIGHTQGSSVNLYGSVDDFRIYDRALERQEIQSIAPPGTDYIRFTFDEPCGSTAHDASSKQLIAELPMGGTWTKGRDGGALSLNGSDQYLQLPADILQACNDLTLAMWVQRRAPTNWERLFSFGQGVKTSMTLAAWTSLNVMQFAAKLNGGSSRGSADELQIASGSTALSPQSGLWGHVAVVLQSGNGHLYFNGQEVGSGPVGIKPSDMGSTVINAVGQPLYVGEPYLGGLVDELRISCRAFPPAEIKILALVGQ